MRSRSAAGVSPVRTQVRISTSASPLPTQPFPDAGQRRLEIAVDVVRERLERRDVDDLGLVGQPALEALPHQVVDRRQKRGERLARAGRRGDEGMAAGLDRRPSLGLGGRRRGETVGEPARDRRDGTGLRRAPARGTASNPVPRRSARREQTLNSKWRCTRSGSLTTPSDEVWDAYIWRRVAFCASFRRGFAPIATKEDCAMTTHPETIVALNDGASMPQFGLGVFQTPPDETEQIVRMAVERGLSARRHRVNVPERRRRRQGAAGSRGRVRHDETRQFRSRLRRNFAGV